MSVLPCPYQICCTHRLAIILRVVTDRLPKLGCSDLVAISNIGNTKIPSLCCSRYAEQILLTFKVLEQTLPPSYSA
ncbi:hypothetical protein [Alginatibacterium sediminis]|uniref:hypothetical protein n=1 Tax=Alginatibacterium sediminis TaxID=2164068 RepID=UPI0011C3A337|nr:hypothetical protein [Alginatibacterium sediminis]